jgi:hypothetical protein
MNKLQYKDMLADTMSDLSTAEKEINRLQILVAKYSDEQNTLKKIVYDNSNDFALGKIIREMYR